MAMIKKAVKGMRDVTPEEMRLRNHVSDVIREIYESYGFTQIETPCVEHIENLSSKQGGENEKLIFKILKRGNKLDIANAKEENDLADSGLRYDLTVPLCRYYADHAAELPQPFKALQMGNVFRADQPQKGRFRQFEQCDIDILGEPSNLAEIELILAMSTVLTRLSFKNFNIRINDRRILKSMAAWAGFAEADYDAVFIILDKMDKIGVEGVIEELEKAGYAKENASKYMELFRLLEGKAGEEALKALSERMGEALSAEGRSNLEEIFSAVNAAKKDGWTLLFDPTLVRGMSYYTGTIFEVELKEFHSSCGGGGRYDEMIGRFTGQQTPACGFSIGFERIITILMEQGYQLPDEKEKTAFLLEKGLPAEKVNEAMSRAEELRAEGKCVQLLRMAKNKKFQKEQLAAQGYTEIKEYFR
ncbi:MAG: histidine--tRNA ligase [Lachnospiraceae bacterium]|nr:histidine--tRNA ligase [Lachnospiraceae bacterium]MCR4642073.1 histidine--tRNA ligase [Lachnospiraceae bacterium]